MKKTFSAVALVVAVTFVTLSSVVYAGQPGKREILGGIPYTGENPCAAGKVYAKDTYAWLKASVASGKMTQEEMIDIMTPLRDRVAVVCRMQ